MISKDWNEFNKHITIINKEISKYEDEEGNYAIIPTANLLCGVQYNEMTEEQLNVAKFDGKVPKDIKLKTKERTKIINKKEKTGKEEDRFTLIDGEKEQVYLIWFIVDGMHNTSAYNNKEKALEIAEERNKEILELV